MLADKSRLIAAMLEPIRTHMQGSVLLSTRIGTNNMYSAKLVRPSQHRKSVGAFPKEQSSFSGASVLEGGVPVRLVSWA